MLPSPHIVVKTISQVTIPARILAIIPTTFTSIPKNNSYYNLAGTQSSSDQNLFIGPLLKIFSAKLPIYLLCIIINTSPDNVILPKDRPVHPVSVNGIKYDIKPNTDFNYL